MGKLERVETTTTSAGGWLERGRGEKKPEDVTALVIAWSLAEPHRLGETALFSGHGPAQVLGRGTYPTRNSQPRVVFVRQRPGENTDMAPLQGKGLSREQIHVEPRDVELRITRLGRGPLSVAGRRVDEGIVRPGDVVVVGEQLVLFCVRRPAILPALKYFPDTLWGPFGAADAFGLVGESPRMWALRDELAFLACTDEHVLLFGDSGTGKELAARARQRLGARKKKPRVARNAAPRPGRRIPGPSSRSTTRAHGGCWRRRRRRASRASSTPRRNRS
jgi:two-component system nitrogen regulation response regulator GlnG/two-component system response regulator HydG